MTAHTTLGRFLYASNPTRLAPLLTFFSHVRTQFGSSIKAVQCDNGREFDHSSARTFFLNHGVVLRMSCPYTSQQNGRAERILRTINNIVRSILFQASLPPVYWADSLHTATYLLNRHPTKTLDGLTPFFSLYGTQPSYDHLRFLAALAIPTYHPQLHINSHLDPLCVCSWGIPLTIRAIGVLIFTQTASSSLAMLLSMRRFFPSPICPPPPRTTPR